jgi:hypothetical protein
VGRHHRHHYHAISIITVTIIAIIITIIVSSVLRSPPPPDSLPARWVRAMDKFYHVSRSIEPKRQALEGAQSELKVVQVTC